MVENKDQQDIEETLKQINILALELLVRVASIEKILVIKNIITHEELVNTVMEASKSISDSVTAAVKEMQKGV